MVSFFWEGVFAIKLLQLQSEAELVKTVGPRDQGGGDEPAAEAPMAEEAVMSEAPVAEEAADPNEFAKGEFEGEEEDLADNGDQVVEDID